MVSLRWPFDSGSDPTPMTDATPDELFEALRTERRRRVVRTIADLGSVELGDLSEIIASQENDCAVAEVTTQQRKRVYVSLYQTHIPKLDDLGVVEAPEGDEPIESTEATGAALDVLATAVEVTGGGE
jgi:hypothetical protein